MKMLTDILKSLFDLIINTIFGTGGCSAEDLQFSIAFNGMIADMCNYLGVIGIGMSIIYFLIEMNRRYAFEGNDLNFKTMLAPLLKLVCTVLVFRKAPTIVKLFLQMYNSIVAKADSLGTSYGDAAAVLNLFDGKDGAGDATGIEAMLNVIFNLLNGFGLWELIIIVLFALLFWLISLVLKLVWKYKAIQLKLEILWKIVITPAAMTDVYSGQNASSIRWIKGFVSLALYGAALILIPHLGGTLVISALSDIDFTENGIKLLMNILAYMAQCLAVPFAELGVLGAVKQLCKEALG